MTHTIRNKQNMLCATSGNQIGQDSSRQQVGGFRTEYGIHKWALKIVINCGVEGHFVFLSLHNLRACMT